MLHCARRIHRRYLHLFDSKMAYPPFSSNVQTRIAELPDHVRYESIALASCRINEEKVEGDIAELGVWRGITSTYLRFIAPTRTLHLFDTFEGFEDGRFQDTSLELVKREIGDCTNVRFHVGHFPATAEHIGNTRFALVMLDADTYETTLPGLQWFYPRLNSGAYLFMHDYNSPESSFGVSRAWRLFSTSIPEKLIEIPDKYGSALIRKI